MLQAGFARVDITPPLGSPLAGYFTIRYAEGILDPLELNAVAFSDGERTAVIISCDLIYVIDPTATEIREQIAKAAGIPAECIFLHGLHQHTSIRVGNKPGIIHADTMRDPSYLSILYRKFCDVTRMAMDDMRPSTLGVAAKETPVPLSFIRRYRMKDGSTRTNPGVLNPDVVGPIGEADNTVRLIRVHREGAKDIAIVNFCTHPDVIGGNRISADWPGFVRRLTEEEMPDVWCILVNGPQGDTNHVAVGNPAHAGKKTPEERYAYSRYMGKVISDTALSVWDQTVPVSGEKVYGEVQYCFIPTNTAGIERFDECVELKRKLDAGEIKLEMGDKAEVNRIAQIRKESLFQRIPVSVLCVGEIGFVGYGGEPFTQYGVASREAAPEMFIVACCLVNGGQGYLPTREAFEEGGYEAKNSRFTPGLADTVQGEAAEMLARYRAFRNEK